MSDIAEALGIPNVRMDNKKDVKMLANAIDQKTDEIIYNFDDEVDESTGEVKRGRGRPKKDPNSLVIVSIKDDGALTPVEQAERGQEYLRREAVILFESTKKLLSELRGELMPGAPAAMWQAYTGLLRAANECHARLSSIYEKIQQKVEFDMPLQNELEQEQTSGPIKMTGSLDDLMNLLEQSKGLDVDDPSLLQNLKTKSTAVTADYTIED